MHCTRLRVHDKDMRRYRLISIGLLVGLVAVRSPGAAIQAQPAQAAVAGAGAKTWAGQTNQIEQGLRTADIARLEDIGTGVTRPRRAYLTPTDLVQSFTWKPLKPATRKGYWESYKSEIAAYELDKLLSLNMVPPVVEREVNGELGAAVLWVEPTTSVKQMGGTLPPGRVPGHEVRRMWMFDNLINNPDRNGGNILVDNARNIILIDHSRAFVARTDLQHKVERVDEELWSAMQALSVEALHEKLGPLVGDAAVNSLLERLKRMQTDVDKLVANKGRASVILPKDR